MFHKKKSSVSKNRNRQLMLNGVGCFIMQNYFMLQKRKIYEIKYASILTKVNKYVKINMKNENNLEEYTVQNILDIAKADNIITVFDFDGALGSYEYGTHNHAIPSDKWTTFVKNEHPFNAGKPFVRPFKAVQNFIKQKSKEDVYVCTVVESMEELIGKREFAVREYGILPDHVHAVSSNQEKLTYLQHLHQIKYGNIEENNIAMIEDNVEILEYIMKHSNFLTIHISSFLE